MNGDLSVADAAEMKRQLIECMSSPKLLQIDASAAGDLDITIIQLLWALLAETEKAGKELGLRGAVSTGVASAIAEAGLPNFLSKYGPDASLQSDGKPND